MRPQTLAARPSVDVALATDALNLDELLPKSEGAAKPAPAAGAGDGRVFPADPLPLDGLKAADAEVKFTAKTIIVQGMQVTDVDLGVDLKSGKLTFRRSPPVSAVARSAVMWRSMRHRARARH